MTCDTSYDVIVIGGGPAGLAAALSARAEGNVRVLLIERNDSLGGILPQCIHNGFGAVIFGNDLPGPEYAYRYQEQVEAADIDVMLDTMVMDLTPERDLYAMNATHGYLHYRPRSIILAMGCRERTRAQIRLPGSRCSGVYTAGTVQRLVNIEGYMPGRRFLILGSGDIGMIMARRLTIEGAEVVGVLELLPFLTGLRRNFVQCLQDYNIPLHLSTTVSNIIGGQRLEAVETVKVDEELQPIPGSTERIECDSLLLSVGLIPENELSLKAGVHLDPRTGGPLVDSTMATDVPGIYAAGNVTSIYDLVDYVSKAGEVAGRHAARYALEHGTGNGNNATAGGATAGGAAAGGATGGRDASKAGAMVAIRPGENVGTVIPQRVRIDTSGNEEVTLMLRPNALIERKVTVELWDGDRPIMSFRENYSRPAEMMVHTLRAKQMQALAEAHEHELTVVIQ